MLKTGRILFVILTLLCPQYAWAQASFLTKVTAYSPEDPEWDNTPVADRNYDEYEAKELHLGSFILKQKTELESGYVSNVYLTDGNEISDKKVTVKPGFVLQSDWGSHGLTLDGEVEAVRFAENDSENENNFRFKASGQVDITSISNIYASSEIKYGHEERKSSRTNIVPYSPFRTKDMVNKLGVNLEKGRFDFITEVLFRRLRFEDDRTRANPALRAVRSDSDRDEKGVSFSTEYAVQRDLGWVVELSYKELSFVRRNFLNGPQTFTGIRRDSTASTLVTGLRGRLFGNVTGNLFLGLTNRNYLEPTLKDSLEQVVEANLSWNPTPIGTLRAGFDRSVEEDEAISGGFVDNTFSIGYDHELLRNFIVTGNASYSERSYSSIARLDKDTTYEIGGKYLFDNHWRLGGGLALEQRDSDQPNADFDNMMMMFRLEHVF